MLRLSLDMLAPFLSFHSVVRQLTNMSVVGIVKLQNLFKRFRPLISLDSQHRKKHQGHLRRQSGQNCGKIGVAKIYEYGTHNHQKIFRVKGGDGCTEFSQIFVKWLVDVTEAEEPPGFAQVVHRKVQDRYCDNVKYNPG